MSELLRGEVEWAPDPAEAGAREREDGEKIEYRDWSPENTKVVSGPTGQNRTNRPGRHFWFKAHARAYWLERAGRIIEEYTLPGRYAFRVRRDA